MGSLNRSEAQRLKLGQFSKNWPQLTDKCQHLYGSLGRCYILIIVYTLFVFHFFSWYFIEETTLFLAQGLTLPGVSLSHH